MTAAAPASMMRTLITSGKWGAGALGITVAALGLPHIRNMPNALTIIGVLMLLGGLLLLVVATMDVRTNPDRSESRGRQLGAVLVGVFGLLLSGQVPGLDDPGQVADDLGQGAVNLAAGRPVSVARASAADRLTLRIESEAGAEAFAAAVEARLKEDLGRQAAPPGLQDRALVSARASGRYTNLATRHFAGRLDVRMKMTGAADACEFNLSSTGVQTLDNAAGQIAGRLGPRIVSMIEGNPTC